MVDKNGNEFIVEEVDKDITRVWIKRNVNWIWIEELNRWISIIEIVRKLKRR